MSFNCRITQHDRHIQRIRGFTERYGCILTNISKKNISNGTPSFKEAKRLFEDINIVKIHSTVDFQSRHIIDLPNSKLSLLNFHQTFFVLNEDFTNYLGSTWEITMILM